jgi:hypothetical protein
MQRLDREGAGCQSGANFWIVLPQPCLVLRDWLMLSNCLCTRLVEPTHRWRGGRVAEGGGLLNRYTAITRIVGSNPIPSATYRS